jgi:hypothetical protein
MCVVVWMDHGRETMVKGNDDGGWSSDDVVLWLWMRQNGDVVEWWVEWLRLRWHFYSSGGCEFGCSRRIVDCGGADLMLWFWLERGMGHDEALSEDEVDAGSSCWLYGKEMWHDAAAWWYVGRRRGGTEEGKGGDNASWADANLTRSKNKKKSRGRLSCYKWTVKI